MTSTTGSRNRSVRAVTAERTEKRANLDEAIAERAYFKFMDRGGEPGFDLVDWLAAEDEIKTEARGHDKGTEGTPREKVAHTR